MVGTHWSTREKGCESIAGRWLTGYYSGKRLLHTVYEAKRAIANYFFIVSGWRTNLKSKALSLRVASSPLFYL